MTYFTSNAKFLPLTVYSSGNKLFVIMNCSSDSTINDGAEIKTINGIPAAEIMNQLMTRQIRDGNNETYPRWILNTYFRSYYGFTFGHPDSFTVLFGTGVTKSVNAISNDSIKYYRQKKYPDPLNGSKDKQGIMLTINQVNKLADLTIKDFHDDALKNIYHQPFKKTIAAFFKTITESEVSTLIIDLRNNQGGDIENGEELLSYLLNKPFNILEKGPSFGIINPKETVFTGKIYVLINGVSFSNSGIVSSCLQKNNRAIFIGEETGGNRVTLNGNIKSGVLPNTKINYQIPSLVYLLRTDIENNGHGVMPDYQIQYSIDDIINSRDKAKEFVLNLIQKN
jgi:hypothetical protein